MSCSCSEQQKRTTFEQLEFNFCFARHVGGTVTTLEIDAGYSNPSVIIRPSNCRMPAPTLVLPWSDVATPIELSDTTFSTLLATLAFGLTVIK